MKTRRDRSFDFEGMSASETGVLRLAESIVMDMFFRDQYIL